MNFRRKNSRVVITGIGIVTAFGCGKTVLRQNLLQATSSIKRSKVPLPSSTEMYCASVDGNPPLPSSIPALHSISRADRFALIAADEALRDTQLDASMLDDAAIVLGVGVGGAEKLSAFLHRDRTQGKDKAPLSWLVSHQPATSTDLVANCFGIRGARSSIMTACSSSAIAIGRGIDLVRLGHTSHAIVGGTDALVPLTLGGFSALRLIDAKPCRPFDTHRNGLSLGEGAAILVLESLESAERRSRPIYAELLGYGLSSDGYHLTAPDPNGYGAIAAMRSALADSHLSTSDIDYVNAHGTGTAQNDSVEARALHTLFGDTVYVSSIKGAVGHTLSAAGAIEAAATSLALHDAFVPSNVGLQIQDPEISLRIVTTPLIDTNVRVALSNSFAFGGNNACLVFRSAHP